MNEDKKLEYQELRDEFALLNQMIATTLNFSVAGCILILSFIFPKIDGKDSILLFFLPLLIIYSSCWLIASRIRAIHKIGTYILVFLEPETEMQWHTRLVKIREKKNLEFRKTILGIYGALILFDISIFLAKGRYDYTDILCYVASAVLFYWMYRMISKGWRQFFIERWNEVKNAEATSLQEDTKQNP